MLAKRTTTPTVFSGAIALAALYGCSLQDYDYLGEGNGAKTNEPTEEPDETTQGSPSTDSSVETLTSETTSDVMSVPDASVTSDGTESEAGTATTSVETSSSPPVQTSENGASSSTVVETSAPPADTTVVEETSDVWVPGPVVVDPDNLLTGTNTNFEGGVGSWTRLGGASISTTTAAAYTGARSLICQGRAQGAWEGPAINGLTILEAGKSYVVSGWVRTKDPEGQPFHIVRKAVCVTDAGPETDDSKIYVQLVGGYTGTEWAQLVSEPFSMPDCDLQTFDIYFEGPPIGEAFYLDDVSIVLVQ